MSRNGIACAANAGKCKQGSAQHLAMSDSQPLILTALLPADLHRWATRLRETHFPPERNYLEAHVTLFHALPPQCEEELRDLLKRVARDNPPLEAAITGLMPMGKGTAIRIESEAMLGLREEIADHFHGMLTGQDQHSIRLHATIQNKVTIEEAKALQSRLSGEVTEQRFDFRGLGLFRYCGGPWEHIRDFVFRG